MITKEQVLKAQNEWAKGVVKIGSLKEKRIVCDAFTDEFINNMYAFENGVVLFKPTKCAHEQFRCTKSKAKSYFIGGDDRECLEDSGFAMAPWFNVRFENLNFILEKNRAIVMGNYYFKSLDNTEVKVEYTFGYKLVSGKLKIDLHHSSIPYKIN